jgi:hypothetical protein
VNRAFEIYKLDNPGQPFPRRFVLLARSAADAAKVIGMPVDSIRGAALGRYIAEPLPEFINSLIETTINKGVMQ